MVDFPASLILKELESIFPATYEHSKETKTGETDTTNNGSSHALFKRQISTGETLSDEQLQAHFQLVKTNLNKLYKRHGPYMYDYDPSMHAANSWEEDKLEEMRTPDLVYVSYYSEPASGSGGKLMFFVSFLLTDEDMKTTLSKSAKMAQRLRSKMQAKNKIVFQTITLFVYELQIVSECRSMGIGHDLLSTYIPQVVLQTKRNIHDSKQTNNSNTVKYTCLVQLTCFEDNTSALKFYLDKCGYVNLFKSLKVASNGHYFILEKQIPTDEEQPRLK